MPERGKYIVIEGSDGSGKSLQAIRLTKVLNGLVVPSPDNGELEPIQEPGGTPRANELRRRIKNKDIERTPWENVEWFTEARSSTWHELIEPALASGQNVITARSWISTVAYQGYGEGVPIDDIRDYTREHVGDAYMTPDLVCILALKDEVERRHRLVNRNTDHEGDTFESMPPEFQAAMQTGYVRFAEDNGIEIIPADGTPDEVEMRILRETVKMFKRGIKPHKWELPRD